MAKFIKSIFTPERRKSRYEEGDEDKNSGVPPLDGRRKLSISRSGRMKQANKKRHSLSLELYNQDTKVPDVPNNTESNTNQKQTLTETKPSSDLQRTQSTELKSPEEEIDSAFEIIDKAEYLK